MNTVPLMVPTKNDDDSDNEEEILNFDDTHGLKLYKPWYVEAENIAENKGFLEMVTQLHVHALPKLAQKKYPIVWFDVHPFMKWFQVDFYLSFLPFSESLFVKMYHE